jgi:curved DNA-binding protein CbpA
MKKPEYDLYKTLGVSRDASIDDIKAAYKAKAKKEHPDVGGNEEKFKEINEAYGVLSDPEKRRRYDETGEHGNGVSIVEAAVAHLKSMMLQVIKENCDPTTTNSPRQFRKQPMGNVCTIETCLNKQIEETKKQISEAGTLLSKLLKEKTKVRLKEKASQSFNIYAAVADDAIGGANKYLLAAKNQKEMLEMALKLLNDYEDVKTSEVSLDRLISRSL